MPAQFLGIDLSSIDWYTCGVAAVAIAVMVYILLAGRNRRRLRGTPGGAGSNDVANAAVLLNDISWGPGHHSHTGSDAGHHGGFFDGGGGDAGGGGHL